MKNFLSINSKFLAFAVLFLLFFAACQEEEEVVIVTLSEEEAVEVIEASVSEETYGMTSYAVESTEIASEEASLLIPSCSVQFDTTITRSSSPQSSITYSYQISQSFELICNGPLPSQLSLNSTASGEYLTSRMESSDNTTFGTTVKGLEASMSEFMLNSSFTRQANQEITGTRRNTVKVVSTNLSIESTNLSIDKQNLEILGGTSTFTMTGSGSQVQNFSFTGQITYNGNGSATVLINGTSYPIQL